MKKIPFSLLTLLSVLLSVSAVAELQPEKIGVIETLPDKYPAHWVIVQDSAFFHMSDGKFIVIDADSDDSSSRVKGMFNGSAIPHFYQAKSRPEMYVVETFHSRGQRGERTDVLTIYEKSTLAPVDEVVLPPKRISAMPTHYYLQLVDDESLALVYNFTPASSVSVVDIEAREFLGEINVPGCGLIFPMAGRAFASLCADGSMMGMQIDKDGGLKSSAHTEKFFDADGDPLIEKPAIINGIAYFPTFLGNVFPVDLRGEMPEPQEPWSLTEGVDGGWRPGGIVLAGADADDQLYVMMHPKGYDGSHKDPAVEIWVFDPEAKQRVKRIELATPAITMGLTHDKQPLLLVTNINLEIDVYDAKQGTHLRTINDIGQETAFMLHGAH